MQEEHLELVRSAFAPVPVLCAPYFDQEVVGAADARPPGRRPVRRSRRGRPCSTTRITQELWSPRRGARLRLALPFARKGDISLKKIGLELIVGVDGQRRTIMLPAALAGFQPAGATFEDGSLEVTFNGTAAT